MKHLKVIESLIANGDADVSAQGLELLVSQSPTARELKAMVLPMLRASRHDRNRAAARIIRRITQTGRHRRLMTVLRNTARQIAFKKLGGWRVVTVRHGMDMLEDLDSPEAARWVLERLLSAPDHILDRTRSSWCQYRLTVIRFVEQQSGESSTLRCDAVMFSKLFDATAMLGPCPPLLKRIVNLRKIDFTGIKRDVPSWLHELDSVEVVEQLYVEKALTLVTPPPRLRTLSLCGSFRSVAISSKTLTSLQLHSSSGKRIGIDLEGCVSLRALGIHSTYSQLSLSAMTRRILERANLSFSDSRYALESLPDELLVRVTHVHESHALPEPLLLRKMRRLRDLSIPLRAYYSAKKDLGETMRSGLGRSLRCLGLHGRKLERVLPDWVLEMGRLRTLRLSSVWAFHPSVAPGYAALQDRGVTIDVTTSYGRASLERLLAEHRLSPNPASATLRPA